MSVLNIVGAILYYIVLAYFLLLFARLIIDWVMYFARDWQPKGIVLVLVELVYSFTDPPLKFSRRFIPPLSLGAIRLDVSFIVVMAICAVLMRIFAALTYL